MHVSEVIEAAAIAIYYQQVGLKPPYPLWEDGDADEKANCRRDAQLAYDTMASFIEGKARVAELRATAADFPTYGREFVYVRADGTSTNNTHYRLLDRAKALEASLEASMLD